MTEYTPSLKNGSVASSPLPFGRDAVHEHNLTSRALTGALRSQAFLDAASEGRALMVLRWAGC